MTERVMNSLAWASVVLGLAYLPASTAALIGVLLLEN